MSSFIHPLQLSSLFTFSPHWVNCKARYRNQKKKKSDFSHPILPHSLFANIQAYDNEHRKPEFMLDDKIPNYLHILYSSSCSKFYCRNLTTPHMSFSLVAFYKNLYYWTWYQVLLSFVFLFCISSKYPKHHYSKTFLFFLVCNHWYLGSLIFPCSSYLPYEVSKWVRVTLPILRLG